MNESEDVVIAGLLQKPSRHADISTLTAEYFKGRETRAWFAYMRRFSDNRDGKNSLDFALARSRLEKSTTRIAPDMLSVLDEYVLLDRITDAEFREAVLSLLKDRKKSILRNRAVDACEHVLEEKWSDAEGAMRAAIIAVQDVAAQDEPPIRFGATALVQRARARLAGELVRDARRFRTGLDQIDKRVSFRPKEMTILGGYTGDGKSTFSKTIGMNAVLDDAAVLLFVALEMSLFEMFVLFAAQYAARLDPAGFDYRSILDGNASKHDLDLYRRVLDEIEFEQFDNGQDGELKMQHGNLFIWSPKKRITARDFHDRVRGLRHDHGLDIVVGDYLELIQPSRNLGQYRLNVKEIAESMKALAREQEVWVILNHQISRQGRDNAEKRDPEQHYLLRDLGESSGVERASDHVLWIYFDEYLRDQREARIGIAKARKGETIASGFNVYCDFPKSIIGNLRDS